MCNGASGPASLVNLIHVPLTKNCPKGGTDIQTGLDNGPGAETNDFTLEGDEVMNDVVICDALPGSIVTLTQLSVGDANCANGGTEIDTGADNGAGKSIANDGILEEGEITATQYVCNGLNGTGGGNAVKTSRIDVSGGNSSAGIGGTGGNVNIDVVGTYGALIQILNTGVANAAFTIPTERAMTSDNGDTDPFEVSQDLTVNTYPDVEQGMGSGEPIFEVDNDGGLYDQINGVQLTSLHVDPGVTLTFSPNTSGQDDFTANVGVNGDVLNEGTITVASPKDAPGALFIKINGNYLGTVSSKASTNGQPCPAEKPDCFSNGNTLEFVIVDKGNGRDFVNHGTLSARGVGGGQGGSVVVINILGSIYNTGAIDVSGGAALSSANSGNDGQASGGGVGFIAAGGGTINNSGAINASGGMCGVDAGGKGGDGGVGGGLFFANHDGPIFNSGAMNVSGGSCSAKNCKGGFGGAAFFVGDTDLRNDADINASGGTGGGGGGDGGLVLAIGLGMQSQDNAVVVSSGSEQFSGSITATGGDGAAAAGTGGVVAMYLMTVTETGQEIDLLNTSDIVANGGAGVAPVDNPGSSAGDAGNVAVGTAMSTVGEMGIPLFPAQNKTAAFLFANDMKIVATAWTQISGYDGTNGSNGSNGSNGTNGSSIFATNPFQPPPDGADNGNAHALINYANITAIGGTGGKGSNGSSGSGGWVQLLGQRVDTLDLQAGNDVIALRAAQMANGGAGGTGGWIQLVALNVDPPDLLDITGDITGDAVTQAAKVHQRGRGQRSGGNVTIPKFEHTSHRHAHAPAHNGNGDVTDDQDITNHGVIIASGGQSAGDGIAECGDNGTCPQSGWGNEVDMYAGASVFNTGAITVDGGALGGAFSSGGGGGYIDFEAGDSITNSAACSLSGAMSTSFNTEGAPGGNLTFFAANAITNTGVITLNGGADTGAESFGGTGGTCSLDAQGGVLTSSAFISAVGGHGGGAGGGAPGFGGKGGEVDITGFSVSVTADISCLAAAGNGLPDGAGGYIEIDSTTDSEPIVSGSFKGETNLPPGAMPGPDGQLVIKNDLGGF